MHTIRYYPYEAGRTLYHIDFTLGILSRSHVYVYVGDNPTEQVSYTWVNDGQISLSVPISVGQELKIQRKLPTTLFNDFENGSRLSAKNLDTSFLQALMLHEEVLDGFLGAEFKFQSLHVIVKSLEVLNSIKVPEPQLSNEATTKQYVDDLVNNLEEYTNVALNNLKQYVDTQDTAIYQYINETVTEAILQGFGSNFVGETPPTTFLRQGLRWYKPSESTTYVYYCDDDSCQWVQEPVQSAEGTLRQELSSADSDVLVGGVEAAEVANFQAPYVSAVRRIHNSKLGDLISINDFSGANDSAKLVNAVASGEGIYIPSNRVYEINEVDLPDGDCTIYGNKAIINTSAAIGIRRAKANYFDRISGIVFTGAGTTYDYQSDFAPLPDFNHKITHHIENCRFLSSSGVHKINLVGAREGFITNCYFQGNAGVRRQFAINTTLQNCFWDNCDYFVLDLLGSEGLVIIGSQALGGSFGVKAERSTGVILKGNIFDFIDAPIDLQGATDVKLLGNYISTRTASPALKTSQYTDGFNGYSYEIVGNTFIANNANGDTAVQLEDIYEVDMSHNQIKNFKVNGLAYGNVTQATFDNNTIRARAGFESSARSIRSLVSGDDSSVSLNNNNVTSPIERTEITPQNMWRNKGFPTENQGEAIIGVGQSSVVVNHGLSITPNKTQISLTPTTPNTKDLNYFISSTTSTTFTITLDTNVADVTAFGWKIR